MVDTKHTFTVYTIPDVFRITGTVVWALNISARGIRMTIVHFHGMSFTAFVDIWKRTYTFRHNQATTNVNQKNVSRCRRLSLQRPSNGRKTQKSINDEGVRNMI